VQSDPFSKNITFWYIYAAVLLIFGFAGIAMGLYVLLFRGGTQGELTHTRTVLLFSIGFISSALVHFQAFKTIKRMKSKMEAS
jgi:hypothetical protein